MDNNLVSIYENSYLRGNVINESDKNQNDSDDGTPKAFRPKASKKKRVKSRKKRPMSNKEIGGITYDSYKRQENIFDKLLREMNEIGGDTGSFEGEDDSVFDADEELSAGGGDDEQTFTLSELRGMTLGEIASLIEGGDSFGGNEEDEYEDEGEDYGFEGEEDMDENDEIPGESYGFTGGEGNYKGDQGTYDGKAKRQSPTSHVKGNGDADFGKNKTGYDPEDTEGSEGSYYGDQGTYDGKAKRQSPTSHVKGNGDADFGKNKTGYRTQSGKKDKNYF